MVSVQNLESGSRAASLEATLLDADGKPVFSLRKLNATTGKDSDFDLQQAGQEPEEMVCGVPYLYKLLSRFATRRAESSR